MKFFFADFRLYQALALSSKRRDNSAASEKAQAKYLLPFFLFPFPFDFPLLVQPVGALRQYVEIWGSPLKVRDLRQVFILHTFRNTNGFGPREQIEMKRIASGFAP